MSDSNLSLFDYFNKLQSEYLLYQFRIKIYPSRADKEKFKEILNYKEQKILDICQSNGLSNMFNNGEVLEEIEKEFYNNFGVPKDLTNKDKYFYYWIGANFSYNGRGVKLISYDLMNQSCVICNTKGENLTVDLNFIRRIL